MAFDQTDLLFVFAVAMIMLAVVSYLAIESRGLQIPNLGLFDTIQRVLDALESKTVPGAPEHTTVAVPTG